MDIGLLGYAAALGLAAAGSALGTGVAAQAAIGAWKKCFAANKPAPFKLLLFVSMPLTQTIYGFVSDEQHRRIGQDRRGTAFGRCFRRPGHGLFGFYAGKSRRCRIGCAG